MSKIQRISLAILIISMNALWHSSTHVGVIISGISAMVFYLVFTGGD